MTKFSVLIMTGLLSSGVLFSAKAANGQAGAFDPTFGKNGKAVFDFSAFSALQNGGSFPDAALLDSRNNILVAAESSNSTSNCSQSTLLRFLPNGELDKSFGESGIASTSLDEISSMATQLDGKIVVTAPGQSCSGLGLIGVVSRFNSNGTVDTSFGNNGQISFDLPIAGQSVTSVSPGSILVQADGKIVVTAQEQSIEAGCIPVPHKSCPGVLSPFIARFNSDGSPDTTFGEDGIVNGAGTDISFGSSGQSTGFALQSNGSILLSALNGGFTELDVDGKFVSPVQIGTIVAITSPNNPSILSNGKLLSANEVSQRVRRVIEFTECAVSRSNSNGAPDTTFQLTEFFFTGNQVGTSDQSFCPDIATAPNGQILVAGTSSFNNAPGLAPELAGAFGLARLNADGGLDSAFGDGGIVTSNFFSTGPAILLVQPDAKIVIVGAATGTTSIDASDGISTLALARFLAN